MTTARVYLADDSPCHKLLVIAFFNNADELVSDGSVEAGIAARDFKVGVADARQENTHQCLVCIVRLLDPTNF